MSEHTKTVASPLEHVRYCCSCSGNNQNSHFHRSVARHFARNYSVVKKEMVGTFKAFGVKTREELLFILLQYTDNKDKMQATLQNWQHLVSS